MTWFVAGLRILEEKSVLRSRLVLHILSNKKNQSTDLVPHKNEHCSKKSSVRFLEEFG